MTTLVHLATPASWAVAVACVVAAIGIAGYAATGDELALRAGVALAVVMGVFAGWAVGEEGE